MQRTKLAMIWKSGPAIKITNSFEMHVFKGILNLAIPPRG